MDGIRVLFRADGGGELGSGHLMRCLALAAALRDRSATCRLLTQRTEAAGAWADFGFPVEPMEATDARDADASDGARTLAVARAFAADWLVVDGYGFDGDFFGAVKGVRTLVFEDTGETDPPARILVNPNAGAETLARRYSGAPTLLLGPRFAPLRKSVVRARRSDAARSGLLVCFGGGDHGERAAEALRAFRAAGGEGTVSVVNGAAPPSDLDLRDLGARWLGPTDLAPLLAQASLAVIGGGVTALEAACVGTPALITVLAPNQRPGALALERCGAACIATHPADAGRMAASLAADADVLTRMATCGRRTVDGAGSERLAAALIEAPASAPPALS